MNKFLTTFVLSLIGVLAITGLGIPASFAANDKITICHRTDSVTNPYVQITVDPNAADEDTGNDNGQGDHAAEHQGPVPTNETEAQALKDSHIEWGDIIPPHDNFPGLNWTTDGQAIYNNGCNYTNVTPTEVPSGTITPTEEVTPTVTLTKTPTPTNPCEGASCNTGGHNTPTPSTGSGPTATVTVTPTEKLLGGANPTATSAPTATASNAASPTPTTAPKQGEATQPLEQVLGASTMAPTGSSTQNMMNLFGIFGMLLLMAGYTSYASDKKQPQN